MAVVEFTCSVTHQGTIDQVKFVPGPEACLPPGQEFGVLISLIYSWEEFGTLQEDVVDTSTVLESWDRRSEKAWKAWVRGPLPLLATLCPTRLSTRMLGICYRETNISVRKISKLQSLHLKKHFCHRIRCRQGTCFTLSLYRSKSW